MSPMAGNRINTVTQASDFTGFLFSDKMIIIVLNIVKEYIATIIQYSQDRLMYSAIEYSIKVL